MKALEYEKQIKKNETDTPEYKISDDDKAAQTYFATRKSQLIQYRKNKKVEELWKAADKAYVPHITDSSKSKKVLASDDTLGWRSRQVTLDLKGSWQEQSVPVNPYIKIQTALGLIVDRNPGAIFRAGAKKYLNNTLLIENLYKHSWDFAKSKTTLLKPFVFNMAKYGIGVGRTYPLKITRTVGDMVSVDPVTTKAKYEDVDFTYYDDVFRENLSPWQCWFDDGGIVGNPFSFNDNMWFKDYSWDTFYEQFGHLDSAKYVKCSSKTLSRINYESEEGNEQGEGAITKKQLRIWFYENVQLDRFYVETDDGVVLINEPIPRKPKHKRLSLFYAPWTIRNDKDIEGIGVYEAMRNDYKVLLKVRNMTIDQLVLSIYKEWFYEGTDTTEKDGVMEIEPGRGRQMVNPQNIKWNVVPGPGKEAWEAINHFEDKIEEATGITRGLSGEVLGKTAFETAQARESALKRLKTPLENLTDALEIEAFITIGLIDDMYSVPKIKLIAEDRFIEAFELEQLQQQAQEQGTETPQFEEQYKEVPLNLSQGTDGKFLKSDEPNFIQLLPKDLDWEGIIRIKGTSIIADSELLERTSTSELAGIITPLLSLPAELVLKPATEIVKAYNKDPKEWLPDVWLNPPAPVTPPPTQGGAEQNPPIPPNAPPAKPIIMPAGQPAPTQ